MENSSSRDSAQLPYQHLQSGKREQGETNAFEPNLWKENHGNWLVGFTAVLCLIGVTIIACEQSRFLPPTFPTRLFRDPAPGGAPAIAQAADGQDPKGVRIVELRIVGAGSDEGTMKIAMYISPEGFNDPARAFEVDSWRIENGICAGRWEISQDVKRVAIAAYHDANDNGELDKNAIGIPSERYGFTAGARGFTGPPTFQEAAITLENQIIDISIR